MNLDAIKRAPKWAWLTAAGVGLGAGAVHLYKNRTSTATDPSTTTDTSTSGTTMGDPTYAGTSSSPPGVIVPPVIMSSPSTDQSGTGLGDLQALYMGGVGSLLDSFQTLLTPLQSEQSSLLDTMSGTVSTLAIANAGAPPQPAVQAPPIIVNLPAPPRAPAPSPRAPGPAPSPCAGEYPFVGPHGCYKVVCASGNGNVARGRWHYYANGVKEHVADTC